MYKKFMLFSCLVFLVSAIYFIYTTFFGQWTPTEKTQQIAHVSEENSVKYVPHADSSKSEQELPTSEERKERWQAPEQTVQESFGEAENGESIFAPELESDDIENRSEISPELEMLFIVANEWRDKNVAISDKKPTFC